MFLYIASVFIVVFGYLSPAWAVTWAEQPLLAWEQTALKFFDRNDYAKVIDLAKEQEVEEIGEEAAVPVVAPETNHLNGTERDALIAAFYKDISDGSF